MSPLFRLTHSGPELGEADRVELAKIRRGATAALACACVGAVLCFLFVFQILAIVFAAVALRRIARSGLGEEYRMRAIVAVLIAVLALIVILIPILNPGMRMKWPT